MSNFQEPGQDSPSYYPNAIYDNVFSPQQPPITPNNEPAADSPRECSVRGCSNPTDPPGPNTFGSKSLKMCAVCREKHRTYASTKRERRKAEKALVYRLSVSAAGTQLQDAVSEPDAWVDATESEDARQPSATVEQYTPSAPTLPTTNFEPPPSVQWAIDPALYSQPVASSSSTLAGALTLPPSVSNPPAVTSPSVAYNTDLSSTPTLSGTQTTSASRDDGSEAVGTIPHPDTGKPRYCSVKGCKAIILESIEEYGFRMCQSCRTRYRLYGVTKRAKWKAERVAYDRELQALREKEDQRRAASGLPPLSESPDDVQAWEQSLIDEQVIPPCAPDPMPMDPLDIPRQVASLPARMCTVSHCHKILPGSYRYKRCETHRVQNRWHSKLKRGREKIEKGFMLPDGTELVAPGPIKTKKIAEPKESEITKNATGTDEAAQKLDNGELNGGEPDATSISPTTEQKGSTRSHRRPKDPSVCKEADCCNLILPGTRWRTCGNCRSKLFKRTPRQPETGGLALANAAPDVNNPELAGSTLSASSSPVIPANATRPDAVATYSPGYTSTSTLLTVNEPPSENRLQSETHGDLNTAGPSTNYVIRPARKYRKYSRLEKDPVTTYISSAEVSSSNGQLASSTSYSYTQLASNSHSQSPTPAYPYPLPPPGPPGTFPYYIPPGYFIPSSTTTRGQPPMVYIPSPYPYAMSPHDKQGASGPPFPYYPYAPPPPGYAHALTQQHSGASNPHTPGTAPPPPPATHTFKTYQYRFNVPLSPAVPPGHSQEYIHYQFKNAPPKKRRRPNAEGEAAVSAPVPGQDPAHPPVMHRFSPPPQNGEQPPADGHAAVAQLPLPGSPRINTSAFLAPESAQPIHAEAAVAATEVSGMSSSISSAPLQSQRTCGSKTCQRILSVATAGPLCEKCRVKMKKRQAMAKQRFRLEPKKIMLPIVGLNSEVPAM
ncbi:hypothetical protein GGX14DRAFT_663758 [Mycena pura]|uniref:Uncharacterized protein n=1 Tax=Mycena pura TaxID=153505 RepID=A0AAD7E072_9AGAR|nr:hypothetical protein GGX14DRAFT_663758 [Mycena pura]